MKILIAASEAAPFAMTGGLGDVMSALPPALNSLGADVRVVIPLYSGIDEKYKSQMSFLGFYYTNLAWRHQYSGVFKYVYKKTTYYFIDNEYYFKRNMMYGEYDDGERYAFFSRAVLDLIPFVDFYPDILHSNDWQTALCPIYLKTEYAKGENYKKILSVHSIHNIEYQGKFNVAIAGDIFSLNKEGFIYTEYDGVLNLTKGAVVCCDRLVTVSPTYAEEICNPYYSHGLDRILNEYKGKLCGILNGIDQTVYNPKTDRDIYKNYSDGSICGKQTNKLMLQKDLGLPQRENVMLISMVTRLASHKGLALVKRVFAELMRADVQMIILGTGEAEYEKFFSHMERIYPDKFRAEIKFDRNLAKKIYAASDVFLMPSEAEPCGLAQMIASRYGAVPLVRETGGLKDSVKHYRSDTREGNGFTFFAYNAHEMLFKIWNMLSFYNLSRDEWNELVRKIMNIDFSFEKSAESYLKLYREMSITDNAK